ncbi:MAG: ABC transporter ATP-binding protein [Ignavibacteriaceae bacterium]|nr:MAG: ABC transporter ATP-binding protein [Chlorobiota bacterium]GJQ33403.1 MAG: ABC transporter ATP-binding protein [Ignavibacteriaceae bacterium]
MIVIKDLHKSFGGNKVLRGLDLTINKGEALTIIGRSGCGKSVLLKHIIGLLKPDQGTVTVEGHDINKIKEKDLYELRKKFGFLFQGAALFDSMTVGENVSLPLIEGNTKFTQTEIDKAVAEKLEMVALPGIEKLKPAELSGGMRKRVGLARALITNPEYILYDEPTTGLDPIMSESIDNLIKELSDKLKVTSIIVTHDMISVNIVAERVAMAHEGKIYFTGTPKELVASEDEVIQDFIARTK